MLKHYSSLSEAEVLALAITNEEEDARIYLNFASKLRPLYPASAKVFEEMADEERRSLQVATIVLAILVFAIGFMVGGIAYRLAP